MLSVNPSLGQTVVLSAAIVGVAGFGATSTVVGPTVNLTARLLEVGAALGEHIVCSKEVARLLDDLPTDLGHHSLKGFLKPVHVFSLA